jgi:uncharacterized protein involved in response to NO
MTMPAPHKPLFLLTGLWGVASPLVWLWPGLVADPVFWHLHEFFFGMAAAAIGGYLLIAAPHWTGRRIGRRALCGLIIAWLAGRGAEILLGPNTVATWGLAVSYPILLAGLLLPPLLRARAWPKLWMAAVPMAIALADLAVLGARQHGTLSPNAPLCLALGFAGLIGFVGGRIVLAFTNSRINLITPTVQLPARTTAGRLAAAAVGLAVLCLITDTTQVLAGVLLCFAALLQVIRLAGWQTPAIMTQTDILMLHMAWAWLTVGLGLVGVALIWPQVLSLTAYLHALTTGAMGSMIFAIAARPFMPRLSGRLVAPPDLSVAFALLTVATALRIFAPDTEVMRVSGLQGAAILWVCAWALFVLRILRQWHYPAPFPILSADLGRKSGALR